MGGLRDFLSDRYSWRERVQLLWSLSVQMDTLTIASLEGWEKPWSQLAQILSDIWNLLLSAHSKKKPSAKDRYYTPLGRKRQGRRSKTVTQAMARMNRLQRLQPGLQSPSGKE